MQNTLTLEEKLHILVFTVNKEEYCIPVNQVREIQLYTKPTRIPYAPYYIKGVINLRGQIIPIVDLSKLMQLGETMAHADSCFIVSEINSELVGIFVDSVLEVLRLPKEMFHLAPTNIVSPINSEYISGVAKWSDRLLILIDFEKIVNTIEIAEGN